MTDLVTVSDGLWASVTTVVGEDVAVVGPPVGGLPEAVAVSETEPVLRSL